MSLVADYFSSSMSESEDSGTDDEKKQVEDEAGGAIGKKCDITTKQALPSANLVLGESSSSIAANSKKGEVFNNPFREAENAKTALLEKHVKMVNKEEYITEKNGRKICWNNRKGRCRFGSNCHYAHDSDLSGSADLHNAADTGQSNKTNQAANSSGARKRKRPGLSDSIQPGKRVIKAYHQQTQAQKKT